MASPPAAVEGSVSSPTRELRFRVGGLPERDERVFKSFVKLLQGKTVDRWVAVDDGPVEVWVLSADAPAPEADDTAHVLRVTMPMRAEDIWGLLDGVSAQVTQRREMFWGSASAVGTPNAPAPLPNGQRRIKLLRWPPDDLLRSDFRYLRLATMLGARALSAEELAVRSRIPLGICRDFFAALQRLELADWLDGPPADGAEPHSERTGLLGRIRSRLGLN